MGKDFVSLTETQRKAYFEHIVTRYEQRIPVVTVYSNKITSSNLPEM